MISIIILNKTIDQFFRKINGARYFTRYPEDWPSWSTDRPAALDDRASMWFACPTPSSTRPPASTAATVIFGGQMLLKIAYFRQSPVTRKKISRNNYLFLVAKCQPQKNSLFSAASSHAAENKWLFSAADIWPPKMWHNYFRRPHVGRRKLTISEKILK